MKFSWRSQTTKTGKVLIVMEPEKGHDAFSDLDDWENV